MLSAGQVLNVFSSGSAKPYHVLIAPDFRSIVWQDPKNGKKLGAIDLRTVIGIHAGTNDGHKCAPPCFVVFVLSCWASLCPE